MIKRNNQKYITAWVGVCIVWICVTIAVIILGLELQTAKALWGYVFALLLGVPKSELKMEGDDDVNDKKE